MPAEIVLLPLDQIDLTAAEEVRDGQNQAVIDQYQGHLEDKAIFPPIEVFFEEKDGQRKNWCWDGYKRWAAHLAHGLSEIECRCFPGTRADARWAALGANSTHGDRRSNTEIQNAVERGVNSARGKKMSTRELARHIGVHHSTIAKYRREQAAPPPNPEPDPTPKPPASEGVSETDTSPVGGETAETQVVEPLEETTATVADPARDDRLKDRAGNIVPRSIEESFRRATRIGKARSRLSQIRGEVKKICEDPHIGVYLHWPQIRVDFDNISRVLRFSEPWSVCPYCKGKGCKVCKQSGWVGQETAAMAPPEE